jgi:hypothetical protein
MRALIQGLPCLASTTECAGSREYRERRRSLAATRFNSILMTQLLSLALLYLALDVVDTLSTFMGDEVPDPVRFFRVVGDLIAAATRSAAGEQSRVTICGECASILWAQGNVNAAIQVERFCNQLTKRYEMDILCGFSLSSFYREEESKSSRRFVAHAELSSAVMGSLTLLHAGNRFAN